MASANALGGLLRDTRVRVGSLLAVALVTGFFLMRFVLFRSNGDVIAVLAEKTGSTERDSGKTQGAWQPAEARATFLVGDGVRTGKQSTAKVDLSDRSTLRLESSTIIRFLEHPSNPNLNRVDLEMGEAVFETGSAPVSLDTDIGVAVLDPGTRVSLTKVDRKTRYEVVVGMARFEAKDGTTTEVTAGQAVMVDIGAARIERVAAEPASSATEATPPATASAAAEPEPKAVDADATEVATRVTGAGASVRKPGEQSFTKLPGGDGHIPGGSTVRLSSGTSADVSRAGQHLTLRGAGEFVVGATGKPFIVTQGGGVALTGAASEVEIAVPGGSIVARLGAKGEAQIGRESTHVTVSDGSVELRGASGAEELSAGEEGTLGKKGAEVEGRGPTYLDLVAAPGASFAVHDPKPPSRPARSVRRAPRYSSAAAHACARTAPP
jgi:ferric-dicitrate binding protein FerR (iron transport regulator)